MPFKPHLDLKIMQCYHDVGGADAWLGGFWDDRSQWFTGWHQSGARGLQGLTDWAWPSDNWSLIGYERWEHRRRGDMLVEAYYVDPNPSTLRDAGPPTGHWHVRFFPNGEWRSSHWCPEALVQGTDYLKGGVTGPKGGHTDRPGKGKGPHNTLRKGKGKGLGKTLHQGKGKGKGKGQED